MYYSICICVREIYFNEYQLQCSFDNTNVEIYNMLATISYIQQILYFTGKPGVVFNKCHHSLVNIENCHTMVNYYFIKFNVF